MSALISGQILQLASADGLWRAEISPVGASLVSLWFGETEIVTSPYGEPLRAVAGAVMAPWPNRLEDGRWNLGDREFTAPINDEAGHNANHGLVLERAFRVVAQTESSLRLETNLFDETAYPFEVTLAVSFELDESGLQVKIEASNVGSQSAPIAFGLHPYFVADVDSQLELNANTWITKNQRNLPEHSLPIDDSSVAKRGWNLVQDLNVDDCFTDLISEEELFVTRLSRPQQDLIVELKQGSELSHLMLYKFEEARGQSRTLIAIEPQTAPANAFRSTEKVKMIAPREHFSSNCKITLRKKS